MVRRHEAERQVQRKGGLVDDLGVHEHLPGAVPGTPTQAVADQRRGDTPALVARIGGEPLEESGVPSAPVEGLAGHRSVDRGDTETTVGCGLLRVGQTLGVKSPERFEGLGIQCECPLTIGSTCTAQLDLARLVRQLTFRLVQPELEHVQAVVLHEAERLERRRLGLGHGRCDHSVVAAFTQGLEYRTQ